MKKLCWKYMKFCFPIELDLELVKE